MATSIRILPSLHLNLSKWNQCIHDHPNGLIYAYSYYLDTVCEQWSGLIINDYQAVMPLPWKTKWGVRYCYIPPFSQQLGIAGDLVGINFETILNSINDFVSYGDFHFNYTNRFINNTVSSHTKTNFFIDLSTGYETISSRYTQDLKDNLRKANRTGMHYVANIPFTEAIQLYQNNYSERIAHINKTHFKHFTKLCSFLATDERCFTRSLIDENNTILSTVLLLKDGERLYNLMNTTTREGRDTEANHLLIDRVLHEFAGQTLLFDFEGSEIPGVKFFYEKFGPVNQAYFHYHHNTLKWPLHKLKS